VTDALFDAAIVETLSGSKNRDAAAHLVHAAVERSGRDNTTALVVNVN
jgi:serine/threonine protein phosphatase PrpC